MTHVVAANPELRYGYTDTIDIAWDAREQESARIMLDLYGVVIIDGTSGKPLIIDSPEFDAVSDDITIKSKA